MEERQPQRRPAWRSRAAGAAAAAALLVAGGAGAIAFTSPTATAVTTAHGAHARAAGDAATVQRLADIEEIHRLKARYFRYIDTKQWSKLAGLFTAHPTIDVGMKYSSGKEMAQTTAALLGNAPTAHQGFLPEIEVRGDTATGTWVMEDYVSFPPGSPYKSGFHGYGQYHETYKRVKGHWYIDSTLLTRFRVDDVPSLPAASASAK
ncbi:nuclear transport factor 2 family protein [Actinacidiphila sp. bgisy160]|uniref:nuclear transport factor 2 family protein n=1 Tax=Actinacidiphila sp. bgisy160 TaxID=3413796 RepID=UPI003D75FD2F